MMRLLHAKVVPHCALHNQNVVNLTGNLPNDSEAAVRLNPYPNATFITSIDQGLLQFVVSLLDSGVLFCAPSNYRRWSWKIQINKQTRSMPSLLFPGVVTSTTASFSDMQELSEPKHIQNTEPKLQTEAQLQRPHWLESLWDTMGKQRIKHIFLHFIHGSPHSTLLIRQC